MLTFIKRYFWNKAIMEKIYTLYIHKREFIYEEKLMTHVSTIQNNSQTYTIEDLQTAINNGTIDTDDVTDVSVFSASADSTACTDGSDDGKLGIGETIGSVFKGAVSGVVNGIKGMFTDEDGNFSLGQTLKTAATAAACFIPGVGPVIAAGLCTVGVVKGATGVVSGVASAVTADTDAEAKAALEQVGSSGVTLGVSAVGLKASAGAIKTNLSNAGVDTSSISSALKGITKSGGESASSIGGTVKNVANNLTGNYYSSVWSQTEGTTLSRIGQTAKQTTVDTGANIVATAKAVKEKATETYNKATGKTGTVESLPEGATQVEGTDTYKVETTKNGKTTTKTYTKNAEGKWDYTTDTTTTSSVTNKNTGETTKTVKNSDGSSTKTVTDKSGNVVEEVKVKADGSTVKTVTDSTTGDVTTTTTAADGTTTTTVRDSYGYEKSSSTTSSAGGSKTTTADFNATELATEYNLTSEQITTLKNGGTVTAKNGTTLTTSAADDMASVTIQTKANAVSKATSALNDWASSINAGEYGTYTVGDETYSTFSTANAKNAAWATASTLASDASDDAKKAVSTASTTYATVNTQTGVEYDLSDYTIMSEEEVDEKYAQIMNQAYML